MKRHPRKIWDDDEVRSLRERVAAGTLSVRQIAADYHISVETVRRMLRGETYFNLAPSQAPSVVDEAALAAGAEALAPSGGSALDRFLRETQESRAQSDKLIKEIFGDEDLEDLQDPPKGPPSEEWSG